MTPEPTKQSSGGFCAGHSGIEEWKTAAGEKFIKIDDAISKLFHKVDGCLPRWTFVLAVTILSALIGSMFLMQWGTYTVMIDTQKSVGVMAVQLQNIDRVKQAEANIIGALKYYHEHPYEEAPK